MNQNNPLPRERRRIFPHILSMRQRSEVIRRHLETRLETVLPIAMRENGFDMWLILCQEDDLDPVFTTMIPMNTWCPILQMLIFYDRGEEEGVERINLSMTGMHGLYDRPWDGRHHEGQWPVLRRVIEERDPQCIGINTGVIQWAAGGLTHNLYTKLVDGLSAKYVDRLASAEPMAVRWLATLTDGEVAMYEHVANVAHHLIAACYSRETIVPGVTTVEDLEWAYWQHSTDAGLQVSFKPFFNIVRSDVAKELYGPDDQTIRPGDLIHCDVGIRYLRLVSDHQEWAYVLRCLYGRV